MNWGRYLHFPALVPAAKTETFTFMEPCTQRRSKSCSGAILKVWQTASKQLIVDKLVNASLEERDQLYLENEDFNFFSTPTRVMLLCGCIKAVEVELFLSSN